MQPKPSNSCPPSQASRFNRSALPPPRPFYEAELGQLGRSNRKGWALGRCPFHQSKSGKSFTVNLNSGGFCCFGCDIHGGDVIAFLRLRYGLNFREACQRLGCWEEAGPRRSTKMLSTPLVRYLVMDFVIDGVEHHAEVLDEPRTELQQMRRFYAEASDRLAEIRNGDPETEEDEAELQRALLATTWELIRMEAENG